MLVCFAVLGWVGPPTAVVLTRQRADVCKLMYHMRVTSDLDDLRAFVDGHFRSVVTFLITPGGRPPPELPLGASAFAPPCLSPSERKQVLGGNEEKHLSMCEDGRTRCGERACVRVPMWRTVGGTRPFTTGPRWRMWAGRAQQHQQCRAVPRPCV